MTRIVQRHDTAANWTSVNPILANGEIGIEDDTKKFKFGDGATAWNSLAYAGGGDAPTVDAYTKAETDTLLEGKENKITPTTPLSLEEKVISSLNGFTYNSLGTAIYQNTNPDGDYWLRNVGDSSYEILRLSTKQLPLQDFSNVTSYLDIPFANEHYYRIKAELLSAMILGKALGNGGIEPIAFVHLTSFSMDVAFPISYSSDIDGSGYNRLRISTRRVAGVQSGSLPIVNGTSTLQFAIRSANAVFKGRYSSSSGGGSIYTCTITDTGLLDKLRQIDTIRLFPNNGYGSSSSYGIYYPDMGYYKTSDDCVNNTNNLFDISAVEKQNQLKLSIDNQTIQLNAQGQLSCNLDEIGADLTSKANVDLSNISDAGKQIIKDNAGASAPTNMVTTDTAQEITGEKTFVSDSSFSGGITIKANDGIANPTTISPSSITTGGVYAESLSAKYGIISLGNYDTTSGIGLEAHVKLNGSTANVPLVKTRGHENFLGVSVGDENVNQLSMGSIEPITRQYDSTNSYTMLDTSNAFKQVKLTQAEYDALTTKDENTLYIIVG